MAAHIIPFCNERTGRIAIENIVSVVINCFKMALNIYIYLTHENVH